MKAVILAGGKGSRLWPLTARRPKPLVPLVDRPAIDHILRLLRHHGFTEVIITMHHLAQLLQDHLGTGGAPGVRLHFSIEHVPLGTAGSVQHASHLLRDTFLVISGDALTDINLSALVAYHRRRQAIATLAVIQVPDPQPYGMVVADGTGRIQRFVEKPPATAVVSNVVNTGIYVLEPEALSCCALAGATDFSRDVFPSLIASGAPLYAFATTDYWTDVGTIPEYMRACFDLVKGRVQPGEAWGASHGALLDRTAPRIWQSGEAEIAPCAQLQGPLYIGRRVRIGPGATIRGPAVIGDYTVVRPGAHIARSILWRGCDVGEQATVDGAIMGDRCTASARARLGEGTVLADYTTLEEGARVWPR